MVTSIHSCSLVGLEPHHVVCEVDLSSQLPTFTLVGLPSALTQESRERIRAAITNSGFEWPSRKVTINLLPAHLPKWGSQFELAMAMGILVTSNERCLRQPLLALGELSLSGEVRPCGWFGVINEWIEKLITTAEARGFRLGLLAHPSDLESLSFILSEAIRKKCDFHPAPDLKTAFSRIEPVLHESAEGGVGLSILSEAGPAQPPSFETLRQVKGEALGTVAALVAIAGKHHALFAGTQGMGKSLLIRAITEASSPLTKREELERQSRLIPFGEHFTKWNTRFPRPVVELQTSISRAALEGALLDSGQVLPGELTRAHSGVLVVNEFLEHRRDVIEAFRQPLEEKVVRLQRAKFRTVLPAGVQLLASTNLCPCGVEGNERKVCRCTKTRKRAYQQRLSGPILDRFDLIVVVGTRKKRFMTRQALKLLIELRKPKNWERFLSQAQTYEPEPLEADAYEFPGSMRSKQKLREVARTIAKLTGEPVGVAHCELALALRVDLEDVLRA